MGVCGVEEIADAARQIPLHQGPISMPGILGRSGRHLKGGPSEAFRKLNMLYIRPWESRATTPRPKCHYHGDVSWYRMPVSRYHTCGLVAVTGTKFLRDPRLTVSYLAISRRIRRASYKCGGNFNSSRLICRAVAICAGSDSRKPAGQGS